MLNELFFDTVKHYNGIINKINDSLLILEAKIVKYIELHPDVILYSFDPSTHVQSQYIKFLYPNIIISLPPFNMAIAYKDFIVQLNGNYTIKNIESLLTKIITDHIGSL